MTSLHNAILMRDSMPQSAEPSAWTCGNQTWQLAEQRLAPGCVPVLAADVGLAAVGLVELVRNLEDCEHQAALRPDPGLVPAPGRAPDEFAGLALALATDEAPLQHVSLLDAHVLMVGQLGARGELHQRGDDARIAVHHQRLRLDPGKACFLPRQRGDIDEAARQRRQLGMVLRVRSQCVHGFLCSPTLTIFMVLVPPALPIGSPMVSTIRSPALHTLFSTSTLSASSSSSSRSWPTYFTISGKTSRNSAHL